MMFVEVPGLSKLKIHIAQGMLACSYHFICRMGPLPKRLQVRGNLIRSCLPREDVTLLYSQFSLNVKVVFEHHFSSLGCIPALNIATHPKQLCSCLCIFLSKTSRILNQIL